MTSIGVSDWTKGQLETEIIPDQELKPLNVQPGGNPLLISNHPEKFSGNGWLMQNAGKADKNGRKGSKYPLSGTFNIYLFHVNGTDRTKYLHLLITNPNNQPITIDYKGSLYASKTKGGVFKKGKIGGQSYKVALDWLRKDFNYKGKGVALQPQKGGFQLLAIPLKPGEMVDGRFEIKSTGGAYVYTVVNDSKDSNQAINDTQYKPSAEGEIIPTGKERYGRYAGVCGSSIWKGVTEVEIPNENSHIGLCLNTSNKLYADQGMGQVLQEQTVAYDMRLSDSTDRTYANYGFEYKVTLKLRNSSSEARKVKISFGHLTTESKIPKGERKPSQTYNGPILVNGKEKPVFTKPEEPKQQLDVLNIAPNSEQNFTLNFFVPGLISIGHQLILESI